jgi:hypothetical protein
MNCYYHPGQAAVAHCVDCGKGLCYDCAHKHTIPICPECNGNRKGYTVWRYAKHVLICAAIFFVVYTVNPLQALRDEERVFNAYMLTCVYGGWIFINQYFPRFLWVLNLRAIPIYLGIKFFVSGLLGFFVTPFVIGYNIIQIIRELQK